MFNKVLIAVCAFVAYFSAPSFAGFDDCIAQYAAGADGWCKVSDDVFDNVRLTDQEANSMGIKGNMGSSAVMVAWGGAAFDPDNLIMYFNGGGHRDYYGNEWYIYDIRAGKFERLNDPSPLDYYRGSAGNWCKFPNPALAHASTHTYDGLQFYQSTGTIFLLGQSGSFACATSEPEGTYVESQQSENIYEFNPSKTEARNGIPPLSYVNHGPHPYSGINRSMVHNGKLYLGSRQYMFEHTPVNGVPVQGARIFGHTLNGEGYAESYPGGVVTYTRNGSMWERPDGGGQFRRRDRSRIPNDGGMACGVTECLFWSGGKNVSLWNWEYPTEYEEIIHDEGPTDGDSRVFSKLHYIPGYDVYVGVSNVNQPVYLYKVAGTEPPIPDPVPDPTPDPLPDPIPDPVPDDFSDWMAQPDWSTFTVNPVSPFTNRQTYSVSNGNTLFIFVIEKDVDNGVFILRAVDRASISENPGLLEAITNGVD